MEGRYAFSQVIILYSAEYYAQIITNHPKDVLSRIKLGQALINENKFTKAKKNLKKLKNNFYNMKASKKDLRFFKVSSLFCLILLTFFAF